MEKGLDAYIREKLEIGDVAINTYSPLTLAYIGDSIYDLVIRTMVVGKGNNKASKLHRESTTYVCAHAQAEIMKELLPFLTEEESEYYKRGRNAKSQTMAKNATMIDYRMATAFETLMGYLYLTDQMDRMMELIKKGIDLWKTT